MLQIRTIKTGQLTLFCPAGNLSQSDKKAELKRVRKFYDSIKECGAKKYSVTNI